MAATMFQNAFGRNKSVKVDRSESFSKPLPPAQSNGTTQNVQPQLVQRSARSNAGDPMSLHLLMENALEDSGAFEVLSSDEVDATRKDLEALCSRIDATQRKLTLETKVRDASKTMNRLDKIEEANEAALRCDELRDELATLQRQEQGLQRRLLEHTAGVLQMTHKGYLRDEPKSNGEVDGMFTQSHFYEPSMLLDAVDGIGGGAADSGKPSAEQQQLIADVQRKVEELNNKMRSTLLELGPGPNDMPGPAPRPVDENGDGLLDQMSYLDECLYKMRNTQKSHQAATNQQSETTHELGNLNNTLYRTVTRNGQDNEFKLVPPPPAEDSTVQAQVDYIGRINECIQLQLDKTEKYDSVIGGLWNVIAVPEQDGEYSLQRFSAKVQEMNVRFSSLQDQKDVLTRQIQQQRELNESGDAQRDKQLSDLQEQLDDSKIELETSRHETNASVEKLTATITELEVVKRELNIALQNQTSSDELNAERQARQAVSTELEAERQARQTASEELATERQGRTQAAEQLDAERQGRKQAEDQLAKTKEELNDTMAMLEANTSAIKADLEAKTKAGENAENEIRELEGRVVQLQTELTFAKADLDSAHGSRAERAAESNNPALQERVQTLENELRDTITDYESMTKATIEHEKEREQLESLIDGLRDRVESLESQLNEERIAAMGMKSPGGTSGTTSTTILRNEFKKMMKDARETHSKTLRSEQEERRKLEAQVRQLKKEALAKK